MQGFFPFPVFIKNENTHNYNYVNHNFLSAAPEMDRLVKEGKDYLLEISNKPLLELTWLKTAMFYRNPDEKAILSNLQQSRLYDTNTFYLTNKAIVDEHFSINIALIANQFSGLENTFQELIPDLKKDTQLFLKFQTLTKREKEILELILKGYTNKQIANLTVTSFNTVRTHRNRIYKKLEIKHFKDCLSYQYFFTR
ncbi:response regulator transcription factor [Winogradskyella immobilis]|uniref:Helix-turn-helix transcriptional regulator n=1 Tax=Winogradskyella immobilis TaxID=2816852 RepID=A0ABS8EJP8_9FLAO|nr:helix-turn-helix transcriptional regulator [Winogradskyella immobilis]MCC1483429.1 helix-turn-helix transcriptional regulator [Winogradskyella immobilis]MCG0015523.1 helix-turn-helix transcriptional regulator [Winogradskyella immobilis]